MPRPVLFRHSTMKRTLLLLSLLFLVTPAEAQTFINGVELSPADAGRVHRQCNALRAREMRSLASEPPEEPEAGQIVGDPASYWADGADDTDQTFSKVNLNKLTLRDCRKAGFY